MILTEAPHVIDKKKSKSLIEILFDCMGFFSPFYFKVNKTFGIY